MREYLRSDRLLMMIEGIVVGDTALAQVGLSNQFPTGYHIMTSNKSLNNECFTHIRFVYVPDWNMIDFVEPAREGYKLLMPTQERALVDATILSLRDDNTKWERVTYNNDLLVSMRHYLDFYDEDTTELMQVAKFFDVEGPIRLLIKECDMVLEQ